MRALLLETSLLFGELVAGILYSRIGILSFTRPAFQVLFLRTGSLFRPCNVASVLLFSHLYRYISPVQLLTLLTIAAGGLFTDCCNFHNKPLQAFCPAFFYEKGAQGIFKERVAVFYPSAGADLQKN